MKSLMFLWRELLIDMSNLCRVGAPIGESSSTTTMSCADFEVLQRRVDNEGLSFLTITLPSLAEDLQKGLMLGEVTPESFRPFKKMAKGSRNPAFLQVFFGLVFDATTGRLLDSVNTDAIYAIRQLSLFFSKIELECSKERIEFAINKYIECELEVKQNDRNLDDDLLRRFDRINLLLSADAFQDIDQKVYDGTLLPKHGPGKTADGKFGNEKFQFTDWTRRLESITPYQEYAIPNLRHYNVDVAASVNLREPGTELPVRVVTVPKTLKTPRIIAIEPSYMQYIQQALSMALVDELESPRGNHFGLIGFTHQEPNQFMALRGSVDGSLATLDLSEASDRVSNQLVRRMLHPFPHFGEAVDASRSRKADVPGHGVIRLAKFASMGSALTFPIEAVVFLTIVLIGIELELKRPINLRDIKSLKGRVRVYGDDIVVPVEYARSAVVALEAFGLKVNSQKSFWIGRFRESCGKEYYDGHDVSITRVRRMLPSQRSDVREIISTVALRNNLYRSGCWRSAAYLDDYLKRLIPLPNVNDTSPVLGRISFLGYETQRSCTLLHRPLVKGYQVRTDYRDSYLDGHSALLKCFLKRSDEPFADKKHLERHGRSEAVNIKLGWGQPF